MRKTDPGTLHLHELAQESSSPKFDKNKICLQIDLIIQITGTMWYC